MAEWLRRLTRNQIPSGSVGSNPTDCEIILISWATWPVIIILQLGSQVHKAFGMFLSFREVWKVLLRVQTSLMSAWVNRPLINCIGLYYSPDGITKVSSPDFGVNDEMRDG